MSLSLDGPSQRWTLKCDAAGCDHVILASSGTHAEQRAELDALAADLGWRQTTDVGTYCRDHAVMLAPPIPREELCRQDPWCVAKEGHAGKCWTAARREIPPTDFGPNAAKRRRF